MMTFSILVGLILRLGWLRQPSQLTKNNRPREIRMPIRYTFKTTSKENWIKAASDAFKIRKTVLQVDPVRFIAFIDPVLCQDDNFFHFWAA